MRATSANPIYAALAAVGSVLAAGSCCLPLGAFWLAAGVAGASSFLNTARPYLMAVSVALVVFGFWQARHAKQCRRRASVLNAVLLWASGAFVAVSLLFPQAFAIILAGGPTYAPSGQPALAPFELAAFQRQFDREPGTKLLVLLSPT